MQSSDFQWLTLNFEPQTLNIQRLVFFHNKYFLFQIICYFSARY